MRLSYSPHCPRCDSGKKKRVLIENTDVQPDKKPSFACGSCYATMEYDYSMIITDPCVVMAIGGLIAKTHGDNGRTVGAFEIVEFGPLTANCGKPDYFVTLEAREAQGYRVTIQAQTALGALPSRKPDIADEQKILRRATMPHVLVQAVDSLNYIGFRGRHRSRDQEQHWVYLDRSNNGEEPLSYRIKMTWPFGV